MTTDTMTAVDHLNPTATISKPYNIMILYFDDGSVYVTCRTDTRDRDRILNSRNDSKGGVWATLRAGVGFRIESPMFLQGITNQRTGKAMQREVRSMLKAKGHTILNQQD